MAACEWTPRPPRSRLPGRLGTGLERTRLSELATAHLPPGGNGRWAPGIRPHDLRHSFASLLLAAGQPVIDVADQLGHAPTLTLDTCGHVMRELEGVRQSPDKAIAAARQLPAARSG